MTTAEKNGKETAKPAAAKVVITSEWQEIWTEFKLGIKVLIGFESPVPPSHKQSASA